jgi:hypothetical protein
VRARLLAALKTADSVAEIDELLEGHAAAVNSYSLVAAVMRVSQLQEQQQRRCPAAQLPTPLQQAAFGRLRKRAFIALVQAGQLSLVRGCHLLAASARMQLPFTREEQSAFEEAAMPGVPREDELWRLQKLHIYYRQLGMHMGFQLAQAVAAALARPAGSPAMPIAFSHVAHHPQQVSPRANRQAFLCMVQAMAASPAETLHSECRGRQSPA